MNIGTRIKEVRKARNITQANLAKLAQTNQSAFSQLESGELNNSTSLPSIAHVLGVNAYWLETGIGSPDVGYVEPTTIQHKHDVLIEQMIELMQLTDDNGKLKMILAAVDTLRLHEALNKAIQHQGQSKESTLLKENELNEKLQNKSFDLISNLKNLIKNKSQT